MADIQLDPQNVTVHLHGLERLWALRGDVRCPRSSVRRATAYDDVFAQVRGIRAPGLGVPGRVKIGTWRSRDGKDLVVVRRGEPGVVVELEGAAWRRLVVGVADRASAERIAAQLSSPD